MTKVLIFFLGLLANLHVLSETKSTKSLYVIKKGDGDNNPKIILLSGPTDNWHSDLGWWVLGQNYLASKYSTVAIERPGQGFSQSIEKPSYVNFANNLSTFISNEKAPVILVAFASSNLSVQLALQSQQVQEKVLGVVFLDPDVLTEHSIEHYTAESENYKKNWQQLKNYIKAGNYQSRIAQKILQEREHLEALVIPELEDYMDWELYDKYEKKRGEANYQINKFKEVTAYKSDLEHAMEASFPMDIPLIILDSDFETGYLKTIEDNKVRQSIIKWRDQGKKQFFDLARRHPCSAYWPIDTQEHLLTYTHPQKIQQAIHRIEMCSNN